MSNESPRPAGRPRRQFRPVEVRAVRRVAPRLVSVSLGGDALAGFEITAPAQHIKLALPGPGQSEPALPQPALPQPGRLQPQAEPASHGPVWPEDRPRPILRTYTPRRWDPETGLLDVELLLHGTGPASEWAERAAVGDRLAVAGPGGRSALPTDAARYVIAGDESALPAMGTLLESLSPAARVEVLAEVAGPEDEIPLPTGPGTTVRWLHRSRPDAWGEALEQALAGTDLGGPSAGTAVWVACEAVAVRRIRRHLLAERHLPPELVVTRGYWRLGEADHPDHDHGED